MRRRAAIRAIPPNGPPREARRAARRRRRRRAPVALAALTLLAAAAVRDGGHGTVPAGARAAEGAGGRPAARAPAAPAPAAAPIDVAYVGDTVMGSLPYGLPADGGAAFFSRVDHLLVGDIVLGNLEGTLTARGTSKCGAGGPDCFAFRTPPSYARHLRDAGFTVMNLANNHANDFGSVGLADTVAALRRVGVRDTGRRGTHATVRAGGRAVTILGFASYAWSDPLTDVPAAARRVRRAARTGRIVIVTFHGGAEGRDRTRVPRGTETYLGENRGDLRRFAHAVVDAGADLVVGSGPHVMRGMEVHRGRLIAYSMGNFAGFRVFSLGGVLSTSGVLQVTLNPDGSFRGGRLRPTLLVGEGTPAPGGDAIALVRALSRGDFGRRAPRIDARGVIRPPA